MVGAVDPRGLRTKRAHFIHHRKERQRETPLNTRVSPHQKIGVGAQVGTLSRLTGKLL